ncbi:MAG: serine/threonine protein kinase [Muribaculaceae bacterium]|nr:serine/threonine protein kinase [Muribaculaceae bacterium]
MAIIRLQGKAEREAGVYYEVDSSGSPIGEGGMGKVYQGTSVDTRTGVTRPVAIKFLFMDLPEQAIERARREASIHLRNDNLIEMLGFIETDENRDGKIVKHYHVVSELLHGVSLADIMQGRCSDPQGNEIPFARQLMNDFQKQPDHFAKIVIKAALSGLLALHDAGYIHRDIDPSNIFITADGHIKIIDFGICKQMKNLTTNDRALTVAGAFMGKPEYASPELALGDLKHQNKTTDIYAMGVLLYQCITGNVPFEGTRFDVLDKQVKEKLPLKDIQNKELRRIITKATEKRQELRYQTAAEMLVDLESLDVKRAVDPRKRMKMIIWSAAGVLLLAGAAVGFAVYRDNVERNRIALEEKNYTDSLTNVVRYRLAEADSLTRAGMRHDEGYDRQFVKAKKSYVQAREAAALLKAKNVAVTDFDAKEKQLDGLLRQTHDELTEKAAVLVSDPDPYVVEEAKAISQRADEIGKLLK